MSRYGLAIDLNRCTGCYACIVACKSENSTPPGVSWIRIETKEEGEYPKASRIYTPLVCMQCAEMPCASVCPSGAIFRGQGGVVLIDDDSCFCGDVKPCTAACPFGVLSVNKAESYFPSYLIPQEKETYEAHREGAVVKCNFCYHRITAGLGPSCVQACPSKAMVFGDLHESESALTQLVSSEDAKPLREDLRVDPSVFYVREAVATRKGRER